MNKKIKNAEINLSKKVISKIKKVERCLK